MSTAFVELINSSPFAIIELFELKLFQDLHGSDEEYYFHAGRNRKTTLPAGSDDILDAYSIKYGGTPYIPCLLYTSPSPRDLSTSRMPSSA